MRLSVPTTAESSDGSSYTAAEVPDMLARYSEAAIHVFMYFYNIALVEQTENALILFDVAAIFAVVTWNADRLH